MAKLIIIEADTNDADYVERTEVISDDELELIRPVIQAIKEFEPYKGKNERGHKWVHNHNFPFGEYTRTDLGELTAEEMYGCLEGFEAFVEDYVPYGEDGIHTIISINVLEVTSTENLLGSPIRGL